MNLPALLGQNSGFHLETRSHQASWRWAATGWALEQRKLLKARILEFDRLHGLASVQPGEQAAGCVGPALATALVASAADPKAFRSRRDFSATPCAHGFRLGGCPRHSALKLETCVTMRPFLVFQKTTALQKFF
jgi:hypothetical protein